MCVCVCVLVRVYVHAGVYTILYKYVFVRAHIQMCM